MNNHQSTRSVFSTTVTKSQDYGKNSSKKEVTDCILQEPKRYWEVTDHCETLLFQEPRPNITFKNPASNYHYQRLITKMGPERELAKQVTNAHLKVLARLNQSKLQVKNFILPVQLIKMKDMDPTSRKRVIEGLSKYFSFQRELRNVVLEQAEVKFPDLCRLLVGIACNPKIKSLFLWHVLDSCDKPFEGPLQSDTVLDDLPRIPYTYNPGGRKYLRDLENEKSLRQSDYSDDSFMDQCLKNVQKPKQTLKSFLSFMSRIISQDINTCTSRKESKGLLTQISAAEDLLKICLTDSSGNESCERLKKQFSEPVHETHVFSQAEVGIQCNISQDIEETIIDVKGGVTYVYSNIDDSRSSTFGSQTELFLKKTRLRVCSEYLKYYEHTLVKREALQDIYKMALNGFTNLSQLAVNYCMLADGTGTALMSIGSLMKGRLRHLKLLCEPDDIPSRTHQVYDDNALQAIPDLIWYNVKEMCPDLKVHVICVSMSAYEETKRFVTKSMPLCSFHLENGFCPNAKIPQLTLSCTFKCLWLDHAKTLEQVTITLWHSTGRFGTVLEKLIRETRLSIFEYYGAVQWKSVINNMCDAGLESPKMKKFKLMIQGDPCFPNTARIVTSDLYDQYRARFQEKSIQFELGTFTS